MKSWIVALSALSSAGCGTVMSPDDGGPSRDTPALVVEAFELAIGQRDRSLYEWLVAPDLEVVNDAGECLEWLDPAYWSESPPDLCGMDLVGFSLQITSQRTLANHDVEVVTGLERLRLHGPGNGSTWELRLLLVMRPEAGGYSIRRLVVPWLSAGSPISTVDIPSSAMYGSAR